MRSTLWESALPLGNDGVSGSRGRVRFGGGGAMRKLVGEEAAELAALVEVHINNFKGHVLGPVVSQQSGSLKVAQPELELELHLGSRREVVVDGCDAPGKAGGLDLHPAIVFEVDTECCHRPMQTYARVAALANNLAVRPHLNRPCPPAVFFPAPPLP